jgi:hypothetical protein
MVQIVQLAPVRIRTAGFDCGRRGTDPVLAGTMKRTMEQGFAAIRSLEMEVQVQLKIHRLEYVWCLFFAT